MRSILTMVLVLASMLVSAQDATVLLHFDSTAHITIPDGDVLEKADIGSTVQLYTTVDNVKAARITFGTGAQINIYKLVFDSEYEETVTLTGYSKSGKQYSISFIGETFVVLSTGDGKALLLYNDTKV